MFSTLYFRRIVMLANFGFCYLYKRAGGRMELDDIVVTKLFDVMTIPIAKGTKRPITNRYCYGLTFCGTDGGRILYEYENRQYLSDYYHAVLLPMGRSYLLNGEKGGNYPLINFYCDHPLNDRQFAVFEISNPQYYLQTYERIKNLCFYNQPFCYARAMGLFYEMLSQLILASETSNPLLSTAVSYMERNYADPELTIDQIAAEINVSVGYFRRMFKAQYSMSPKKYILNARIVKAKELLIGTSCLSISEIACACGFTNLYHFDRTFKVHTGCSPTEYLQTFGNNF